MLAVVVPVSMEPEAEEGVLMPGLIALPSRQEIAIHLRLGPGEQAVRVTAVTVRLPRLTPQLVSPPTVLVV